ncbi:MAG: DNA polymerase III subunit beta [Planctomycetes bacterium]|nr:DNA polymerase III subunit beta [Planctomycetota bacterium]
MRILCRRDGLLSAFQLASTAIAGHDHKPVLQNVKATAGMDRCTLQATNLELGIRLNFNSTIVEEPGEVLLPAARTLAIMREGADEEWAVETRDNTCHVRGQSSEFEFSTEEPTHFPDVPEFDADKYHEIQAGVLREMIRRTLFAVASESNRYAITGVLWELEGKSARLIGTDGRRLAFAQGAAIAHAEHSASGLTSIVPAKAMQLLNRNLHNPDETVWINFKANEAHFKTENVTVYARLVEGRFPRYRDILPKKANVKIPLIVGPFFTALRQAAIMADDDNRKVILHFAKQKLTMEACGADTGRSKVELPIDFSGKSAEIAFDPKSLIDMLNVLPADATIVLEMADDKTPATFRCGDDFSYIVVPLV